MVVGPARYSTTQPRAPSSRPDSNPAAPTALRASPSGRGPGKADEEHGRPAGAISSAGQPHGACTRRPAGAVGEHGRRPPSTGISQRPSWSHTPTAQPLYARRRVCPLAHQERSTRRTRTFPLAGPRQNRDKMASTSGLQTGGQPRYVDATRPAQRHREKESRLRA